MQSKTVSGAIATMLFRIIGVVFLVVAIIHFVATPLILRGAFDGNVAPRAEAIVRASFLLNHLVVGILLMPMGLSTILAAPGIAGNDKLSRRIGWANTLASVAMPITVAAVMGREQIVGGGPFTIAVALVTIAPLALLAAMWITRPNGPRRIASETA